MTAPRNATTDDYAAVHADPEQIAVGYGSTGHFRCLADILAKEMMATDCKSVVDLGTGDGAFLRWCADSVQSVATVTGIDPGLPPFSETRAGCVVRRVHLDWKRCMSVPGYLADWVTSFDFLEHLEPDDVVECIRACWEQCGIGMAHTWAMISDVRRVNGEMLEMHPTVRPYEWWQDRFLDACTGAVRMQYMQCIPGQPEWRAGIIAVRQPAWEGRQAP